MIALLLLLSAASALPAAAPPSALATPQQSCVRAAGSEIVVCGTPPPQSRAIPPPQATYRLPRLAPRSYGPAIPGAQSDLGHGVRAKLRGQASNSGRARRNKPIATLSVPF